MANMRPSPCGSRSSTRGSSARAAAPSRAIRSGPPRRPNYGLSGARPAVPGCSRRFSRPLRPASARDASLRGAGQQRRDAPDGDAAIFAGGSRRLHLELLGAVALRRQILGRHLEVLGEDDGDVFVTRDHDARRRQRHEDFYASGTPHAVVDQDELAAVPGPAHTAQQAAALVDVSNDLHVARTPHQCDDFAAAALDAHVLPGQAEALDFVMTDERAPVLADDHAVIRLFDHGALPAVLGALLPLLALRFELLRPALITGSGRRRALGIRA